MRTWARCVHFQEASLTTGESFNLNPVGESGAAMLAQAATSQGRILESASKGEAGRMVGEKRCPAAGSIPVGFISPLSPVEPGGGGGWRPGWCCGAGAGGFCRERSPSDSFHREFFSIRPGGGGGGGAGLRMKMKGTVYTFGKIGFPLGVTPIPS